MNIKKYIKKFLKIVFKDKKYPVPKLVYSNKMLNNKIALIVIQNYFKNIVFYYIIRI